MVNLYKLYLSLVQDIYFIVYFIPFVLEFIAVVTTFLKEIKEHMLSIIFWIRAIHHEFLIFCKTLNMVAFVVFPPLFR